MGLVYLLFYIEPMFQKNWIFYGSLSVLNDSSSLHIDIVRSLFSFLSIQKKRRKKASESGKVIIII